MTEYVPDESSEQPVGTGRPPAIFLFQPHSFRRVTPSRLAEWEQTMLAHFGLNADEMPFDELSVLRGGTWSDSGPSGQTARMTATTSPMISILTHILRILTSFQSNLVRRRSSCSSHHPSPESDPTGSRSGSRSCKSTSG